MLIINSSLIMRFVLPNSFIASFLRQFAMDNIDPQAAIRIGVLVSFFLLNTHRCFEAFLLFTECLVLLERLPGQFSYFYEPAAVGWHFFNRGADCYDRSYFKESIQYHERGLDIFKEIGSSLGQAWSHCYLGRALYGVCRYDEATEHYQKALEIPGVKGDERRRLEGRVYNNLGEAYQVRGNYDKAHSYYQKALKISQAVGNKIEMAVSYNNLGVICHNRLGKLDEALVYHQKALEIRKESGYRIAQGTSYHNIGGVYQVRGEYQKALEFYEKSLVIGKETKSKQMEGRNMLFIGKVYHRLSQLKRAKEYTEGAIEIFSEIGARGAEGGARGELGRLYVELGDYEKAMEQYKQYLKICEEIGDLEGKGNYFSDMGGIYASLGDYEKSKKYIKKQIDILQAIGNKIGLGKAYYNLGRIFWCDEKSSHEYLEKALKLTKETGDREGEAASTNNLGSLYLALGEHDKAIEYAEKALAIRKEIGDRKGEMSSYTLLGSVKLAQGENQKAIEYQTRAIEIIKEIGIRNHLKCNVLENLGLAHASEREFAKACDFLLEGIKHHQSTRSSVKDESNKLSLDNTEFSSFKTLSWLLLCQEKVHDALFALELGRGRALVDLISQRYGIQRAADTIEVTSSSLQKFFQHHKRNVLFIAVLQSIIALWFIDKKGNIKFKKGYEQELSKGKKVDVAKTWFGVDRSLLEDREVQCEDRSLSALYDDCSSDEVEQSKMSKTHIVRKGEETERKNQSSQQLNAWSALIAPIVDLIEGPEIVIAPEGGFFMVPFAALKDDQGKYLSDKVRIRLVPSLSTLKLIQDSPTDYHCNTGALIVGDPKIGPVEVKGNVVELCPLPKAREEAQMISRLLGLPCLVGEQATKEEVLKRIQDVSLVHIAAHGDAERGEVALAPNSSVNGIPKKDDFMLTVKDVAEVGIRAKLVVLSCCHSACGKILTAEGVVGIARAFLGSGARSVLMSLWAVDDEATKGFMEIFYKCLIREKKSASEALHLAMKTMRESPLYKDANGWASFVLLGDDVTFGF